MFKVLVSIHDGILYNEEVDYVVVSSKEGEFAILENHVNLITTVKEGTIKLVRDKDIVFIAINEAAIIFNNNELKVAALEAFVGKTKQRAKELLIEQRKNRLERNRKIILNWKLLKEN